MPELPEVETVARGLQKTVLGRKILSVQLGKTDFIDDPGALEQHLPGRRIDAVERYGKFMLVRLSHPENANAQVPGGEAESAALLVHLGMTGNIASYLAAQPAEKHTHVWMPLDDGRELRYSDPRRFGRLAYLSGEAIPAELQRFGADPLLVTAEDFLARMHPRHSRIKSLLLDQSVLRGVGNIYADESLWRAKIHPAKVAANVPQAQLARLRRGLQDILQKAIVLRGSTIADFQDGDGEPGEYQNHHRAYGREGHACRRCGTIIRRTVVAGRSSYYCPKCQPAPRDSAPLPLPAKFRVDKTKKPKARTGRWKIVHRGRSPSNR
jgi:formamidopyrimidine-DNA glycosylase